MHPRSGSVCKRCLTWGAHSEIRLRNLHEKRGWCILKMFPSSQDVCQKGDSSSDSITDSETTFSEIKSEYSRISKTLWSPSAKRCGVRSQSIAGKSMRYGIQSYGGKDCIATRTRVPCTFCTFHTNSPHGR